MERITLSFNNDADWREFRVECLKRGISASSAVKVLIYEQLARWHEENARREAGEQPEHDTTAGTPSIPAQRGRPKSRA